MVLRDINWLGDEPLSSFTKDAPLPMFVKVRSTRPPEAAHLYQDDDGVKVVLIEGEAGVSPGQACVFYENEADDCRVLGGGWIKHAEKSAQVEAAMTTLLSIDA